MFPTHMPGPMFPTHMNTNTPLIPTPPQNISIRVVQGDDKSTNAPCDNQTGSSNNTPQVHMGEMDAKPATIEGLKGPIVVTKI